MGFFNSYSWGSANPGLDPAIGAADSRMDELRNFQSPGNKFAKSILRGLRRGDTSMIGNPFLAQLGGQNREVDANMDPFLPPEVAQARANLQKNRNQEQAGMNFENYVRGMAVPSMQLTEQHGQFKEGELDSLTQAKMRAWLDAYQKQQNQGWGSMALGAAFGGLESLGGLGWSPFGKKP